MNKKHIFFLIIVIISFSPIHAMFTRTTTRLPKQAIRQPQIMRQQAQRRLMQTKQQQSAVTLIKTPTETNVTISRATLPASPIQSGFWSYWTALKNKIFGVRTAAPIPTAPIQKTVSSTAPTIAVPTAQHVFARIDAINTLPEAEKELTSLTRTQLHTIKKDARIPEGLWTDLIEKIHAAAQYIQENCFTQAHPDASWDADIPEKIKNKIIFYLNNQGINPESISVHYRDTAIIDPFGHDTISAIGPTITYQTDMNYDRDVISGYQPATISLHKQNIAKLTESQFEAKLQHTITHLKQAHNEQLTLLQNTLKPEKYARYIEPYKQALEREADFLEPIKNAQVAKIVQRAFVEDALDTVLKDIKNTREKLGIENKETGLMVCAPPGELPQFLLDMNSFDDIKKYIYEKKEAIVRKYFEGDEELLEIWRQENSESSIEKLQNLYYKDPKPNVVEDKDLPIIFRTITKKLLENTVIDPRSISIISKKNFEKITGNHFSKYVNGYAKGPIKYQKKNFNYIALNEDLLVNAPLNAITQTIAHEIGHLLRMHVYTRVSLGHIYITKFPYFSIEEKGYRILLEKNLIQQLNAIEELEADITYAMLHSEIAKTILTHSLSLVATGTLSNANITRSRFGIHPGINISYHWIKKIVELHQKESSFVKTSADMDATKIKIQPLFTSKREYNE